MDLGGSICLASDRFRRGPYPLRKGIVGVHCKLRLALPMRQSNRLRICSVKMSMSPPDGDTLPRKDGARHLCQKGISQDRITMRPSPSCSHLSSLDRRIVIFRSGCGALLLIILTSSTGSFSRAEPQAHLKAGCDLSHPI
jgi:hypothetical protein